MCKRYVMMYFFCEVSVFQCLIGVNKVTLICPDVSLRMQYYFLLTYSFFCFVYEVPSLVVS
jgi:hypothetical protein